MFHIEACVFNGQNADSSGGATNRAMRSTAEHGLPLPGWGTKFTNVTAFFRTGRDVADCTG